MQPGFPHLKYRPLVVAEGIWHDYTLLLYYRKVIQSVLFMELSNDIMVITIARLWKYYTGTLPGSIIDIHHFSQHVSSSFPSEAKLIASEPRKLRMV